MYVYAHGENKKALRIDLERNKDMFLVISTMELYSKSAKNIYNVDSLTAYAHKLPVKFNHKLKTEFEETGSYEMNKLRVDIIVDECMQYLMNALGYPNNFIYFKSRFSSFENITSEQLGSNLRDELIRIM